MSGHSLVTGFHKILAMLWGFVRKSDKHHSRACSFIVQSSVSVDAWTHLAIVQYTCMCGRSAGPRAQPSGLFEPVKYPVLDAVSHKNLPAKDEMERYLQRGWEEFGGFSDGYRTHERLFSTGLLGSNLDQ